MSYQQETEAQSHARFWQLVGRVGIVILLPVALPILGAFFWLGKNAERLDNHKDLLNKQTEIVAKLTSLMAEQGITVADHEDEIEKLRFKVDAMVQDMLETRYGSPGAGRFPGALDSP